MPKNSPHTFHIPVMGTGFTIDTPLTVAKYGISSVISLVDDVLIEQMRKFWSERLGEPYTEISSKVEDSRAKRITAYLDLLSNLTNKQIIQIKAAPFNPDSEITLYYEMLPNGKLKQVFNTMLNEKDPNIKSQLQQYLRDSVVPGSIDVNLMTKLDRQHYQYDGVIPPYEYSDAASALRGYANSNLASTIILSAGFNPYLYGYINKFNDFLPNEKNELKKKICLKVSDYRSAAIQGKYLAKHGIWISEYRVESPLNCGGHAFVNDGQLMGPILEEFKQRKQELAETLHVLYIKALKQIEKFHSDSPQSVKITAQGGVGTSEEHSYLIDHYQIDSIGWGTPFLLVPEATNVDDKQLDKLLNAGPNDVYLSESSPLGVPFWNLRTSTSEEARLENIRKGTPGSACVKGFCRSNQEFTSYPICPASREYQKYKLQELQKMALPLQQLTVLKENVLNKSCICHELGNGAVMKKGIEKDVPSAICPGPNLVNFNKLMSLKEIINHIYGRDSMLVNKNRVHMFIRELQLQIDYLVDESKKSALGLQIRSKDKINTVKANLINGIKYYQNLAKEILRDQQEFFSDALSELAKVFPE